jgi:hypothetical protein
MSLQERRGREEETIRQRLILLTEERQGWFSHLIRVSFSSAFLMRSSPSPSGDVEAVTGLADDAQGELFEKPAS